MVSIGGVVVATIKARDDPDFREQAENAVPFTARLFSGSAPRPLYHNHFVMPKLWSSDTVVLICKPYGPNTYSFLVKLQYR